MKRLQHQTRRITLRQRDEVGKQLPSMWDGLPIESRKALLRTLVMGVNLDRGEDGIVAIRIFWQGGRVTRLKSWFRFVLVVTDTSTIELSNEFGNSFKRAPRRTRPYRNSTEKASFPAAAASSQPGA